MDAFELHEILHRQAKDLAEAKPSVNQNIIFQTPDKNILNLESSEPIQINKTLYPFPMKNVLKVGGLFLAGIWVYKEIKNNIGYKSDFRKRLTRKRSPEADTNQD